MSSDRREKLQIVFALDADSSCVDGEGGGKFADIAHVRALTPAHVLQLVVAIMEQSGFPMEFKENGEEGAIDAGTYLKRVESSGRWSIPLEARGVSFRFGCVSNLKQSFLSVEEVRAGSIACWEDWVVPFFNEKSFVQAWVADVEYEYWQNAKDPLQYEAAGRPHDELPKRSNGLPPPLEQVEIDISRNPGRCVLRSGYVESIGTPMWLSPIFWRYVGKERRAPLLAAGWLEPLESGIDRIVLPMQSFCDGSAGGTQFKLRSALYG
ncbi:hypothetical protein [Hydrogenophaga sp. 5NK40-0174]|uniref:hypothetical protein n=1 Tax=Hydrogenophaga sp. 5NK40-0174 TaxID=3127649 RepID=UPI003102C2F1